VLAGDSVTVTLVLRSPDTQGTYYVVWDVFEAMNGWFSWSGSRTPSSILAVALRRPR
jgi:hypothetical protein